MDVFEFDVLRSRMKDADGNIIEDDQVTYAIPEEAERLLQPIMEPYNQSPAWFFDGINYGRPPVPWAIMCLDHDYEIGGHIASCRPHEWAVRFLQYGKRPEPPPGDYVPRAGVLVCLDKEDLRVSAHFSPLFQTFWGVVADRSEDFNWLLIADPLPQDWLDKVVPADKELWQSR